MPSFDPVTAVSRALEVLLAINRFEVATIAQLHQETKLHKSTVLRMLETLIHDGFVARLTDGRGYTVTGKCTLLSSGFKAANAIARVSNPFLAQFRREQGWAVDIAIFDHDAMYISLTDHPFGTMSLNRRGERAPMFMSSLGLSYLAFCDKSFVDALIHRLAASSDPYDSPAKDPDKLHAKLRAVRERGYATPDPYYIKNAFQNLVGAISAPVLVAGKACASIVVVYHVAIMDANKASELILPGLLELTARIGSALESEYGLQQAVEAVTVGGR